MQSPALHDVRWYKSDGTAVGVRESLVAGQTYYAELGGEDTIWDAIQWVYDAAIVVTITIETCNLDVWSPDAVVAAPDFWQGARVWQSATGKWCPETAIPTVTIAGGGSASDSVTQNQHNAGSGMRRMRAKAVVGATGGKLRGIPHHKA